MNDLDILENIIPLSGLKLLLNKKTGNIEQRAEIKQQLLGSGRNKAQVVMIGPVVITESAAVQELLRPLLSGVSSGVSAISTQPTASDPETLEYLMARLLNSLPPPRWKCLSSLARRVSRDMAANNKEAAQYLGLSERTMRNHKARDEPISARD